MEKFVYQTFMKRTVIQKIIFLTDAFQLVIDEFRPDKSEDRPNRMNLFRGGRFVGYIEGKVNEYTKESLQNEMPFVLYTSIGRIAGFYDAHFELFDYKIENRMNFFEKAEGLFIVSKYSDKRMPPFRIASYLSIENSKKERVHFSFNGCASNSIVEVVKNMGQFGEAVTLYLDGILQHVYYPKTNRRVELATVKMELENQDKLLGDFRFYENEPYKKSFDISSFSHFSFRQILGSFNYSDISSEIEAFDPRFFTFLNDIRNEFIFQDAKSNIPLNIYDRMAGLCFMQPGDKFFYDFTIAEEEKNTIEQNPVLNRMHKYNRIKMNSKKYWA